MPSSKMPSSLLIKKYVTLIVACADFALDKAPVFHNNIYALSPISGIVTDLASTYIITALL
jgi:hypothetical protein